MYDWWYALKPAYFSSVTDMRLHLIIRQYTWYLGISLILKKKLLNFISVGESSCGLMIIPDIDNLPDANVKTMQL